MAIFERESQEFMMQVGAHPIGALFEGYFHDRNSDMLPIKMAEHQIRCDSPQCPHNLMNMIEFGREAPLDQMRIPAGPYAGQKVEYNGEPGNEFVYMMKDLMHPERLARVQKEKRRIGMFVLPVTPITIRHRDQQGKEIFRETVGRNVTQEQLIAEVCEDGHVVHEAIKKLEEKGWWQVNVQMAREGPYHRIYKRQRALVIGLDPKTNIERAKKQMLETIDMVMNYPIQEQS
jgi:hypothetical protein